MSRSAYNAVERKIGNGLLDSYTFSFKITELDHLKVVLINADGTLNFECRGSDTLHLDSVVFDPVDGGGTVSLFTPLASNATLHLYLADDSPLQPSRFRDKGDFTLRKIEAALDVLSGQIQRLAYRLGRAMVFEDVVTDETKTLLVGSLPTDETIPMWTTADGVIWVAKSAFKGDAGEGLPPGGDTGAVLAKTSAVDSETEWHQYAYSGYSARFSQIFNSTTLDDTLSKILNLQYTPPSVSLSASGSGTIREKGDPVTSSVLSATITKKSDPIAAVRFYKDGVLVNTVASPNPAGGYESFSWSGSFSDNTTFSTQVDDNGATGGPTTVSASSGFTFVYPYFVGAGASGLSGASIAALTKRIIISTSNRTEVIAASAGNVFYFAYPFSYGALTSILDVNNFETLPDWTARTVSITGLDTTVQTYRVYEFNNPVTAGSYQYTFKR